MAQQHLTIVVQRYAARAAIEDRHADLRLNLLNRFTDGGLSQV